MYYRFLVTSAIVGALLVVMSPVANAANFTVADGVNNNIAKSLGGVTRIIEQGGTLAILGTRAFISLYYHTKTHSEL